MSDYFNDLVNETNLENALKGTGLEGEQYGLDEDFEGADYLVNEYNRDEDYSGLAN